MPHRITNYRNKHRPVRFLFSLNFPFRTSEEKSYWFDHAYGEESDTASIYRHTAKPLVEGLLRGFNATVFAYGSTGAGKTHTMVGYDQGEGIWGRGIMGLTLQDLFERVSRRRSEKQIDIKCSFLEVYNENIRDLITVPEGRGGGQEYLDLREDPIKGIVVAGISEVGYSFWGEDFDSEKMIRCPQF